MFLQFLDSIQISRIDKKVVHVSSKILARAGSEWRAVVYTVQDLLICFSHVAGSLDFADNAVPLVYVTAGSNCVTTSLLQRARW